MTIDSITCNGSVTKVISEALAIDTSYTMVLDNETPNPLNTHANNHGNLRQRTSSTLHILNEPKFFCDATKSNRHMNFYSNYTDTYLMLRFNIIYQYMDPLQAEAWALLLGTKTTNALNFQVANILTNCHVLATAVKGRSYRHYPGHLSLRPAMAEIEAITLLDAGDFQLSDRLWQDRL